MQQESLISWLSKHFLLVIVIDIFSFKKHIKQKNTTNECGSIGEMNKYDKDHSYNGEETKYWVSMRVSEKKLKASKPLSNQTH